MKNRKIVGMAIGVLVVMGALLLWLSGQKAESELLELVQNIETQAQTATPRYRTPIPRPDGLSPRAKQAAVKAAIQNLKAAQQGTQEDAEQDANLDVVFEPVGLLSKEAVNEVIRSKLGELLRCTQDWADSEADKHAQGIDGALSNAEGRMVMGIHLDEQGVDFVEILDVEVVPEFVMGCFSDFIYDAQWPSTDEPVLIEYPFVVEIVSEPESN